MKIGIDARLYGPKHTGIGRYTQNLLHELIRLSPEDEFFIFGVPAELLELAQYPNVHIEKLNTKIYSLAEQIINPLIFSRFHLDLLHVPHFNAPIFYPGKVVITVHDLIKHLSTGPQTTTLPSWQYYFKHLAYRIIVNLNLKKAKAVITPAHYWKNYLINQFQVPASKIFVTYEAVSQKLKPVLKPSKQILTKYHLKKPYLIYTGNLYPHKNVPLLINAVNNFNQNHQTKLTLAIIAGRSVFQKKYPQTDFIKPLGFVPDSDFPQLYYHALSLVQPSLIEGFGLTGLEAMQLELPVISSNSTCLPEIYQDAALYFDPYNQKDLEEKLLQIIKEPSLRTQLIAKGKKQVSKFSWQQTAQDTLKAYQYAFK